LDVTDRHRLDRASQALTAAHRDELRHVPMETLARIAAHLAGRNPDKHTSIKYGDLVAFDGAMWRYPDFLARAEAAYRF
jgi:hypothetical protein